MSKKKSSSKDTSLRDRLLTGLGPDAEGTPTREITVMTRLSREIVEVLDNLVKLNFFKSRSEAAAVIIEQKVLANTDMFRELGKQAKKFEEVQSELESLAIKALKE